MAKRRTKDQKRRATERRLEQRTHQPMREESKTSPATLMSAAGSSPAVSSGGAPVASELARVLAQAGKSKVETSENTASLQRFFGFDPQLIYRDLRRTIIISCIILVLLVVFSRLSF